MAMLDDGVVYIGRIAFYSYLGYSSLFNKEIKSVLSTLQEEEKKENGSVYDISIA